ncbi:type II secretion system protein N [Blastomonas sp.]|uniref:type II secretion system protein N n=1 Tax=Blastomonas sp. TaxID=1909299 RepID=UPI0026292078|nr:type II secretion system protein N [Blastomonas sp.]MDM7958091.1 type II secretion system protein N [Blastomonas sp.]
MNRTTRRAGLIVLVLIIALVLLLPLRIVFDMSGLGSRGVSARSVEGSVWSGTIRDLRLGRLSLGDMDAGLSAGGLLRGETVLAMTRAADIPGQPPLAFDLARSGDSIAMRGASGDIATADLFAPLPLRSVTLDGANIAFVGRRCSAASGAVRVNIEQSLFGITLQRGLTGTLRCDGDDLLIPLRGQSGLEQMDIRITGAGRYTADFTLGGLAGGAGAALSALGFRQQGDAMAIRINGRF